MNVHRLHALDGDLSPRVSPQAMEDEAGPSDFDLRALIQALLVRRWTIMGTVIAAMTIVTLIVLQMTPIYTASTAIMVGQRENKVIDVESVLAGLPNDTATIENQIQILKSSLLAQRVIKKLNLDHDAEFSGGKQGTGILSMLLSLVGLRERAAPAPQAQGTIDPAILKRFAGKLTVAAQGRSSIIRVSFDSLDRAKAATIANAIADQYIVDQLEAKFDASKRAGDWLNERLGQLADQVRVAESAVEQYKGANGLSGSTDDNSATTQQMTDLNGQIVLSRSNVAEQEAKFRQVNTLYHSGGGVDSIADVLNSPLISQLRGQQADLIRKEAELATKYGERHPQMIALKDERKNLDKKIDEEVRRIIQNQANQVNVARARLASLEESLKTMQTTAGGEGQVRIRLRELQRQAESSRTLYQSTLGRAKETQDKDQIQAPDARPIETATEPREPSFPNKTLILGITLFASTVLGILFALLLERLDNGFRTGVEIERMARVANLAVVPSVARGRDVAERVIQKPLSSFTEALRSLHAGIQLSNVDQPPKVVLITSSVPNEGKTSIAVSLGRLAARGGARVILVDGDLRHPSVAEQFGERKVDAGLIDVLTGKRDLATILQRDPISPLEYLPVAMPPSNPADLIGSQALKNLVDVLRLHYDLVILDAAPMLPVADTRLLSRLADKTVYVVHWDKTPREAVMSGLKMLRDAGAEIAGTVLNQADMRRHAIYGYGYSSYGYGSYYGKYYAE